VNRSNCRRTPRGVVFFLVWFFLACNRGPQSAAPQRVYFEFTSLRCPNVDRGVGFVIFSCRHGSLPALNPQPPPKPSLVFPFVSRLFRRRWPITNHSCLPPIPICLLAQISPLLSSPNPVPHTMIYDVCLASRQVKYPHKLQISYHPPLLARNERRPAPFSPNCHFFFPCAPSAAVA